MNECQNPKCDILHKNKKYCSRQCQGAVSILTLNQRPDILEKRGRSISRAIQKHYQEDPNAVKKRMIGRGDNYWGELNELETLCRKKLKLIHDRCKRDNLITDFSNSRQGLRELVEYLGEVPDDMEVPSVGREDHSKGYIRGNFGWQELSENLADGAMRSPIGLDPSYYGRKGNTSRKRNNIK